MAVCTCKRSKCSMVISESQNTQIQCRKSLVTTLKQNVPGQKDFTYITVLFSNVFQHQVAHTFPLQHVNCTHLTVLCNLLLSYMQQHTLSHVHKCFSIGIKACSHSVSGTDCKLPWEVKISSFFVLPFLCWDCV